MFLLRCPPVPQTWMPCSAFFCENDCLRKLPQLQGMQKALELDPEQSRHYILGRSRQKGVKYIPISSQAWWRNWRCRSWFNTQKLFSFGTSRRQHLSQGGSVFLECWWKWSWGGASHKWVLASNINLKAHVLLSTSEKLPRNTSKITGRDCDLQNKEAGPDQDPESGTKRWILVKFGLPMLMLPYHVPIGSWY